jgi:4-amino-4-deoxy-L-arabinose transferase-like glycosyltransferase
LIRKTLFNRFRFLYSWPSNPWVYFHLFLAINLFLSYTSFSLQYKWILGLSLLTAILIFQFKYNSSLPRRHDPGYSREWLFISPARILCLAVLAMALRFVKLTSFFTYPLFDDVLNAFFAFHLNLDWNWHPFFYYSQMPPLYIWFLAGMFKIGEVSSFSLWFFPALVSLLCVPLSYYACRTFFSKSMSLIGCLLVAASFWPLWLGRISHQMGLMLLWEWLALWCLGKYLNSTSSGSWKFTILLGLCIGGGFYTFFAWPVIALFVSGVVLTRAIRSGRLLTALLFLFAVLTAVSPLLWAAIQDDYGYYVTHRWLTKGSKEWDLLHSLYYVSTLFWEGWKDYFGYAPRWGGFLNPILGAFVGVGLGEVWRLRKNPLVLAWVGAFVLFLTPVMLTDNYSASRLTPLLPICLIGSALGIQTLALSVGSLWNKKYLLFLLIISLGLDGLNLYQTRSYTNRCPEGPKYTRYELAYSQIAQLEKKGSGAAFTNFINDTRDRSLSFLTYPFNVVINPRIPSDSISWAVVLTDEEYKLCLSRGFPGIQWYWLDWDLRDMKGAIFFVRGMYLGVIPLSMSNRQTVQKWLKAGRDLENIALDDLNHVPSRSHDALIKKMKAFYPDFEVDGFLKTFFWEKVAKAYAEDKNHAAALEALDRSIQAACPRGYLYHQKGQLLVKMKQYGKARETFLEAGRLDKRFIPAPEAIKLLGRLEKSERLDLIGEP